MKITTKTDYAVILLTELAAKKSGPLSLQTVADKTGISEAYLQRIAAKLKKGNLIKPKHGAFGGYTLSKQPNKISLLDIIRTVGDDLNCVKCLKQGKPCPHKGSCPNNKGWHAFQKKLNALYEDTKISNLKP